MGTITAELVAGGEKRDLSGRKLMGEARRREVLEGYERSNLTQREFARQEGISYHTFVTWLSRRRHEGGSVKKVPTRFTEVRLPVPSGLEVCLPNGLVVRGQDGTAVAALVKALGAITRC